MDYIDELEKTVHQKIQAILLEGEFFVSLRTTPLTLRGYQEFVKQKYGAVSYFLPFLQKGAELARPVSQSIHNVFQENLNDELGMFAGKIRENYAHENWRLRSLKTFGLTKEEVQAIQPLPNVARYKELIETLPRSECFLEVVGALLFNELFVVYEMKELIQAFERDLPQLFPTNGYEYEKFPDNIQEYWYSHASHDVWHFNQIREALQTYIEENNLGVSETKEIEKGIEKVYGAKSIFYSKALFDEISLL